MDFVSLSTVHLELLGIKAEKTVSLFVRHLKYISMEDVCVKQAIKTIIDMEIVHLNVLISKLEKMDIVNVLPITRLLIMESVSLTVLLEVT